MGVWHVGARGAWCWAPGSKRTKVVDWTWSSWEAISGCWGLGPSDAVVPAAMNTGTYSLYFKRAKTTPCRTPSLHINVFALLLTLGCSVLRGPSAQSYCSNIPQGKAGIPANSYCHHCQTMCQEGTVMEVVHLAKSIAPEWGNATSCFLWIKKNYASTKHPTNLQDNNDQEDKEVLIHHLGGFLLGHHFCTRIPQHSLLENRVTYTKYINILK